MGRAFEYRRAAKEKRWDKMSKVFPKLGKLITIAAKEGGSDLEMNGKLRTAIQNAKAENMPKDNILAAIKRAESKDVEAYQELIFEGKGPHGVLVFVECASDNNNRTVANIKSYFNKANGLLVPNGALEFMFNRKAVFEVEKSEEKPLVIEDLELELIDFGLEEIVEEDDKILFYADFTDFGALAKGLETLGIEVNKASLKRFATSPVEFSDEQLVDIEKMLDKIEDDDDVQSCFTNIAN